MKKNVYRRYPEIKKLTVIKLRSKGKTYPQISKLTKVPVATIGYWVRNASIVTPKEAKRLFTTFRSVPKGWARASKI